MCKSLLFRVMGKNEEEIKEETVVEAAGLKTPTYGAQVHKVTH